MVYDTRGEKAMALAGLAVAKPGAHELRARMSMASVRRRVARAHKMKMFGWLRMVGRARDSDDVAMWVLICATRVTQERYACAQDRLLK